VLLPAGGEFSLGAGAQDDDQRSGNNGGGH